MPSKTQVMPRPSNNYKYQQWVISKPVKGYSGFADLTYKTADYSHFQGAEDKLIRRLKKVAYLAGKEAIVTYHYGKSLFTIMVTYRTNLKDWGDIVEEGKKIINIFEKELIFFGK